MCPYELALKLHELGVNSESEFYFVKEMKGGGTQMESVTQNTMRYFREEQLPRRDKACSGYQFLLTYKKKEMSSIKNAKILL